MKVPLKIPLIKRMVNVREKLISRKFFKLLVLFTFWLILTAFRNGGQITSQNLFDFLLGAIEHIFKELLLSWLLI